jgi:hypothetical protein
MLPTKFQLIWLSGFRGEDFLEINQSETRIACGAMFESFSFFCDGKYHTCIALLQDKFVPYGIMN